jgi:hypothetical protein
LVRVFVLLAICSVVPARAAESLEQTIAFFLHRIETTDATFIRNGQAHRHREDSIRLTVTKSLLTGQPYLVRTRDGSARDRFGAKTLRIENAYFLPDDLMRKELTEAAKRGA